VSKKKKVHHGSLSHRWTDHGPIAEWTEPVCGLPLGLSVKGGNLVIHPRRLMTTRKDEVTCLNCQKRLGKGGV